MTIRRISALLLALVLAFALCACGSKQPAASNDVSANLEGVPAIPDFTGTNTASIKGVEDGVLTVGL